MTAQRAAEVADLLGTTTTAVNRMLARARARLEQVAPDQDQIHEPADPADRDLLDRYASAFQNADIPAVMQLLREDAVFEMPPEPTWFTGRELIGRFLQTRVLTEPGRFQMIPTAANGQPALAAYIRGHDGGYRAHSICVLTIAASRVARVTSFIDPRLFAAFGLPQTAPAAAGALPGHSALARPPLIGQSVVGERGHIPAPAGAGTDDPQAGRIGEAEEAGHTRCGTPLPLVL